MMLESSCNKITVVLGHAVVEWILILLLLLNSAFSYLIIKYAEFFGVEQRPCPSCTRLDHFFDHRKLALSQDMCHHCLFQSMEFSKNKLSFRVIRNEKEKVDGEVKFKCCCGVRFDFDTTLYSSYLLLESWHDEVLKDWSAACNDYDRNLKEEILEEESPSVSMSVDDEMEELEVGMVAKEDEEIFQEMAWDDVHTASSSEELAQMDNNNENEVDVSIRREDQESVHSYAFTQDLPSTSSHNLDETDDHHVETSVDSLNQFLLKGSDIGSGESLDGSVTSDLEDGEGVVTIESLKSALRAERKCSQSLYAELEEERSASAEAVIQAMAMINRLHEEKAAMQMEAFQYQRMMEEQSEYDQQALQVMNDIMVKLNKEKQEMEQKLLHHETKEKMRVFMKSVGLLM